jgi:DNA-binding HxlR family transcriptional regulator
MSGRPRAVPDNTVPDTTALDEHACSIARSLEIIGDRWTILILRDAFRGIRRFDDFRRDLDIARPVLADRLKRLVERDVLTKVQYETHPPRYEYRLTPMGMELSPILVALMRWGDRYLAGDDGPPTVLVHEPCGHRLQQGFWCPSCEQTFSPADIASRPGPGAPSDDPPTHPGGARGRSARTPAR